MLKCATIAEQIAVYLNKGKSMTILLRPMIREDIPQVNEIDREAFPTQYLPNYRQELQNQIAHYVVAYDNTRTTEVTSNQHKTGISRLWLRIRRRFDHTQETDIPPNAQYYIVGFAGIWLLADEAHITNIAVRSQYQRLGIGELMLIRCIDIAKKLKAHNMTLEVRVSNTNAQNLYRKYGFRQVGLRRAYYIDNREDALLMSTENIHSTSFQAHFNQLKENLTRKMRC